MLTTSRLNKILSYLLGVAFTALIFSQYAAAETELKFENAVVFGGPSIQAGNALVINEDRLYAAGAETSLQPKSLAVSYLVSLPNNPLTNFIWQYDTSSSDVFNDVAVTSEGLYFAGRSIPKTGVATGSFSKFSLQASGSPTAKWAVKPLFLNKATDGILYSTIAHEEFIYVTGNASSSVSNSTAVLAKYNQNGQMIWSKSLSETKERSKGTGTALAVKNEFIYVAGYTGSGGKSVAFVNIPIKLTLWKYDLSGKQIWKKEFAKLYSKDDVRVNISASGEHLYVSALKARDENSSVLISKYDQEGGLIWNAEWPPTSDKSEDKIIPTTAHLAAGGSDRIYVAGQLERKSENVAGFLLEVDKEYGFVLASHHHSEANFNEKVSDIQADSLNNEIFLVGSKIATKVKDKNTVDSDLMLLRFVPLPVVQVKIDMNPPKPKEESLKKGKKEKAEKEKKNTLSVAILTTSEFNAISEINQSSLTFGRTGNEMNWDSCAMKDMNADGKLDLLCYFKNQIRVQSNLVDVIRPEDEEGILKGQTKSGSRIRGVDSTGKAQPESTPVPEEPTPVTPSPEPIVTQPITSEPTVSPTPLVSKPVISEPEPIVQTNQISPEPNAMETMSSTQSPILEEAPAPVSAPPPTNTEQIVLTSTVVAGPSTSDPTSETITSDAVIISESTVPKVYDTEPLPMESASTPTESLAVSYSSSTSTKYLTPLMPTNNTSPTSTPITPVTIPISGSTSTTASPTAAGLPKMKTFSSLPSDYSTREATYGKILRSEPLSEESEEYLEAEHSVRDQNLSSKPTESLGLAQAYSDMGRNAMKMKQPAKAVEYYKEALQHAPASAEIHTNLGLALLETNQLEEAKNHFMEALKLNPEDSLAKNKLETILAKH